MGESRRPSLLAQIVTWTVVGVLALVALKVVVAALRVLANVFGILLGVLLTLTFTILPIAVLGWLVMKLIERLRRADER
ncbi:MAG: hypothetical protein DIU52_008925 [bacterium]|jgi:hypothetical protein